MKKYYENWQTGEILELTEQEFKNLYLNPRQWDEISLDRYNELKNLDSGTCFIGDEER